VAVNADRRESDLAPAPAETLALWRNTAQGPERRGNHRGREEAVLAMVVRYDAALALAVAESLLSNRHLSVDKEAA